MTVFVGARPEVSVGRAARCLYLISDRQTPLPCTSRAGRVVGWRLVRGSAAQMIVGLAREGRKHGVRKVQRKGVEGLETGQLVGLMVSLL